MDYYFSKTLATTFETALDRITEELKKEGFGIISEINLHDKFQEKLGVEFKKYRILGACNPGLAYKALQAEDKIGTMLPCNVLVIDQGNGQTEVAAVNPVASMMAVQNPGLRSVAGEVTERLQRVINAL
jgi:uncharacterized protein (DUF302 family)